MAKKEMRISRCLITGRKFRYEYRGRRPREYIDDDARRLASYLVQTHTLVTELGTKYGFTEAARRDLRRQLTQIVNDPVLSLSKKTYPSLENIADRRKW